MTLSMTPSSERDRAGGTLVLSKPIPGGEAHWIDIKHHRRSRRSGFGIEREALAEGQQARRN
jgi:hypothetical protein